MKCKRGWSRTCEGIRLAARMQEGGVELPHNEMVKKLEGEVLNLPLMKWWECERGGIEPLAMKWWERERRGVEPLPMKWHGENEGG
jgi:hypothetical protein